MRFEQNQVQCTAPWALARTAEQPVLFTATGLALVLRAFGTVPEAKLLSKHPPKVDISGRRGCRLLEGQVSPACISFHVRTVVTAESVSV